MINNLPKPIALYVAAENSGDANLLDQCFAENAVVKDEGKTITGLAAIKRWKSETKEKYQHIIPARLPRGAAFEEWIKKYAPVIGPLNLHAEQPPPGAPCARAGGGHGLEGKLDSR